MKKAGLIIIILILISFLAITLTKAQETPPGLPEILTPEKTEETAEKAGEIKEEVEKLGEKEYLKQQWKELLLKKPYIGGGIKVLDNISKLLLKRELEFSWTYLFTFAIWVTIIVLFYQSLKPALNMSWLIASLSGIIVASLALRAIPSAWFEFQARVIWKVMILVVIILIIASDKVLMDYLEKKAKEEKEKIRERKAKLVEKVHDITIKSAKS